MAVRGYVGWVVLGVFLLAPAMPVCGQYTAVTSPFNNVGSSFYENIGVNWGFSAGGFNFSYGPMAVPGIPGAGGMPGAGANLGFGFGGSGGSGFMNLHAAQGSNATINSQAASVVVPNGGTGSIFSGQVRPFVTGLVPVVGDYSAIPRALGAPAGPARSPLQESIARLEASQWRPNSAGLQERAAPEERPDRRAALPGAGVVGPVSTADRGDLGVAEIRRQQAGEDAAAEREVAVLVERARGAEARGKPNVAKIYYRQAASRATGEAKQKILARIESLRREY